MAAKLSLVFAIGLSIAPAFAQTQIGGGTCSSASLNGNYAFTLTGRQVGATGTFVKVQQSVGMVSFDGQGHITFTLSTNSSAAASAQQSYSGTYTLPSNCLGTVVATVSGVTENFSLAVYNTGKAFLMSGSDGTFTLTGSGTQEPGSCLISSLSGVYALSSNGFSVASNAVTGVDDITGLLQFDGNGNLTVNLNVTGGATASTVNASGQYSVSNGCLYSAKFTDSNGKTWNLNLSVTNATGADFDVIGSNGQLVFSGSAHSSFVNPGQAVVNGASFVADYSPPGTVFSIFGQGLATGIAQASTVPLPNTLLSTTVTINGVPAPLFYISPGQINAQIPVSIPLGLATVVVKNGTSTSNAAAFTVPATGPGIVTFSQNGENRAVVVNPDHSVNTDTTPAKVNDILVAYFTGGGPVQNNGLLTGSAAPNALSPVSDDYTVTVSGKTAAVTYVGLTPGSIGLYQANFQVPSVAAGNHPLVLTIGGQASNAPVISVSN